MPRLDIHDYALPAAALAPRLIGCRLVRVLSDGDTVSGVIVEAEAYVGVRDRCSHAFSGRRTPRNESMYARPGTAYVYFTYGMHFCFNVVCAAEGDPQAVLIRALAPDAGLPRMRSHRGPAARRDVDLCSGPGKLTQALAIDRELDGLDLTADPRLWIEPRQGRPPRLLTSARIGVGDASPWCRRKLRWFSAEHPHVSR